MTQYFGKYRGTVVDNHDPRRLGRLKVVVPAVNGDNIPMWAMTCVPYAGKGVGLWALPPVGSLVWVEFEGGDPEFPIVSGGFWREGDVPVGAGTPDVIGLFTSAGALTFSGKGREAAATWSLGAFGAEPEATIPEATINATAQGLAIVAKGAKITITEQGIDIVTAKGAVTVNGAAVNLRPSGDASGEG